LAVLNQFLSSISSSKLSLFGDCIKHVSLIRNSLLFWLIADTISKKIKLKNICKVKPLAKFMRRPWMWFVCFEETAFSSSPNIKNNIPIWMSHVLCININKDLSKASVNDKESFWVFRQIISTNVIKAHSPIVTM